MHRTPWWTPHVRLKIRIHPTRLKLQGHQKYLRVKLLITTDSQLQVARGDTLHLQILRSVARQLEHFGCEVFQDSSAVDRRSASNTTVRSGSLSQMAMDTTNWEL